MATPGIIGVLSGEGPKSEDVLAAIGLVGHGQALGDRRPKAPVVLPGERGK